VVKSVAYVEKLEVEVKKGDFGVTIFCSDTGWLLSIAYEGRTFFSATGDRKEAVLKRLDDFIAELIEVSRHVESVAKRVEDIRENLAKE
jgi:hypothetical protein